MVDDMAAFLRSIGPEFDGKEQVILEATGAVDLKELIDLVDCREDLRDLDKAEVGMKALHVKKLFRAIMQAKEKFTGTAPPSSMVKTQDEPPQVFPKLEKLMSSVPEHSVKEPSFYVACSDASKHSELPARDEAPEAAGVTGEAVQEPIRSMPSSLREAQEQSQPEKVKVPLPDPLPRGPLIGANKKQQKPASGPSQPAAFAATAQDFPSLGAGGSMPQVTRRALEGGEGAKAAERAFRAAELARLAAEQAEKAAAEAAGADGATAANAALARRMLGGGQRLLRKEAYDRVVEFSWEASTWKFVDGRVEYGVASPISALAEEQFVEEFKGALQAFWEANQPAGGLPWATPEIEDLMAFEPAPKKSKKGKETKPYAMFMFKSLEDVQFIEHLYHLRLQPEAPTIPILKIQGQALRAERPNPLFVQRVASSKGSDTASQAGSAVGSENSHSSTCPSEYRNLTLLFLNLPEAAASLSQRPSVKKAIEEFAGKVLAGLPFARDNIKFAASFSEPRKAPYGGCWLTFRYTVEKKRINPDDGKPYTFEALKDLYQGKKKDVVKLWERGTDAAFDLERKLAGGEGKKPLSISRWFLNEVQEKGFKCEVGGNALTVQFKHSG